MTERQIKSLGRKWAAQMKDLGEKVRPRKTFTVKGGAKRVALHWFVDTLGNVTVFTTQGHVLQLLRNELVHAFSAAK